MVDFSKHLDDRWVSERMPVIIEFMVDDGDDQWLRDKIRGLNSPPPKTQKVIVQGTREAERLMRMLPNLKYARRKPYGGAIRRRAERGEDY